MDIFVYGTLRSHALMAAVSGHAAPHATPAQLPGYCVFGVDGNVVPFIAPQSDASAQGLIYKGLSGQQMARLNLYEGAFGYRLTEVVVETADGARPVQCYLPPDDVAPAGAAWSLEDWEAEHLAPAVLAAR